MCGIAGVISFAAPPSADEALAMARAIVHRGPDDEGVHAEGPCALSFRRLSIIDIEGGHQPMSAGPVTVVFNGEIYNFRELRKELEQKGHTFSSHSDTEVLLNAYLAYGEDFVPKLDGMFAFALWDKRTQRLLIARDRFGKKPLYWSHAGDRFLFGSELKALMAHPSCPRTIHRQALRQYLAYDAVPTPDAIFEGVHKLPAGSVLTLDARGHRISRFWSPPPSARKGAPAPDVGEVISRIRELFAAAVRRRLVSDVPLGVFLSGGIDSSAVAAFAAREAPGIQTFSMAFEEASYDESEYARAAAKAFGTRHHEERLSADACVRLLPEVISHIDEPFADASYLPTLLLSRFARKHVTVALGGDGADELFGGYDTFGVDQAARLLGRLPSILPRLGAQVMAALPASSGYMGIDYKMRVFLRGLSYPERYRHQAWIGSFTADEIDDVLTPPWRAPQGRAVQDIYAPADRFDASSDERGLERSLRYYVDTYLPDDILVKVDRASMATSLEVRGPFLDTALAEYVLRLPTSLKVRGTQRKWILKQALRGIVPDEILFRKKHGFAIPVADWLRGPLRPMVEDLLGERALREGGIFDVKAVRHRVDAHMAKKADHRKALWSLLMFEAWRRRWAKPADLPQPQRSEERRSIA